MPKSGQPWDGGFLERSPLLADFRELGRPLLAAGRWPTWDEYTSLAERERQERAPALPGVRFAPAAPRKRRRRRGELDLEQLYDARIALSGEVPCLNASYHDLLNVLAWAAFPRTKHALHARQFRALSSWAPPGASRLPNRRTREQDALTLFDEGGSVLITTKEVASRLTDLPAAGVPLAAEPDARIVLFGHALMEHVIFYRTRVRSAALLLCLDRPVPSGRELLELVDQALERRLLDEQQFTAPDFDRVLSIEPPAAAWVQGPESTPRVSGRR